MPSWSKRNARIRLRIDSLHASQADPEPAKQVDAFDPEPAKQVDAFDP